MQWTTVYQHIHCLISPNEDPVQTTPLSPEDPAELGGFELLGRVGQGGMGQVYLGESPGGEPAAVKIMRAEGELARDLGASLTEPRVVDDQAPTPPFRSKHA
ncbi:hypothetical protein [Streptomyces sp. NPDC005283]|uniref:hypothetical protein n=1 Tax=Streptomyces sp. NPDC005283 TaxID=3156871 RepID=UPI003453F86B